MANKTIAEISTIRGFDSIAELKADTSLTTVNTAVGKTAEVRGVGSLVTVASDGDLQNSAVPPVHFNVLRPKAQTSAFGSDAAALQKAFNWAHETRGILLLDNDITLSTNVFHGHLSLHQAGGSITINSDDTFVSISGGGAWTAGQGAAILTRSANLNTIYAEPVNTQYDIQVTGGVKVDFYHTSATKPWYPWRIIGAREGSLIHLDLRGFAQTGVVGGFNTNNTEGLDLYFYNRCTVAGSYVVVGTAGVNEQGVALNIRHIGLGAFGPETESRIHLDSPYVYSDNTDEPVAIYNSAAGNGYLHVTGSVLGYGDYGMGVSILNNSEEPDVNFSVHLDYVRASGPIKHGQGILKIENTAATIGVADVYLTGARADVTVGGAVVSTGASGGGRDQKVPRIGRLNIYVDGDFDCGGNIVDIIRGHVIVDHVEVHRVSGTTTWRHTVDQNFLGEIRGGNLPTGQTSAANLSCIKNVALDGPINHCPVAENVNITWDVDAFSNIYAHTDPAWAALSGVSPRVVFSGTITATGSATPTRVINNSATTTGVVIDADYFADFTAAGGSPSGTDQSDGSFIAYRAIHKFGSTTTRPLRTLQAKKFRMRRETITFDASGLGVLTHGLNGTPRTVVVTPFHSGLALRDYIVGVYSISATQVLLHCYKPTTTVDFVAETVANARTPYVGDLDVMYAVALNNEES